MARSDSFESIINNNVELVEAWIEEGLTYKKIAEELGIGYSTFRKYKTSNIALKNAISRGQEKKNQEVEAALFKCCNGYAYYEEVATKVKEEVMSEDGKTILIKEDIKVVEVKKYKGPDLASIKYWLNNKEKKKWKEDPTKADLGKKNLKIKEKEVEGKSW